MAKQKEIKYGIEIVKPWSVAMYAHNEKVLEQVKQILFKQIADISEEAANEKIQDVEFRLVATDEVKRFQKAITCYGFGQGFTYARVIEEMVKHVQDLENWRGNEIVKELNIELEQGFVGFAN